MWQSISYTGTQANTHVKWLAAETSEHILHSASKTVKVALTSHYSFSLPLHLPLILSLPLCVFLPLLPLMAGMEFQTGAVISVDDCHRVFFFFKNKEGFMLSTYRLWGEISQCHTLHSRALAAFLSACNCRILFDHKDDCTLRSSPETLSISLVTVTSQTQP